MTAGRILFVLFSLSCSFGNAARVPDLESHFRQAIKNAKELLHNVKDPQGTEHTFDNKYDLAEWYVNVGLGAIARTMEGLGISPVVMSEAKKHVDAGWKVSLEFTQDVGVKFDEKVPRPQPDKQNQFEYHWTASFNMKVALTTPADPSVFSREVHSAASTMKIIRSVGDEKPFPGKVIRRSIPLSWFLSRLIIPTGGDVAFNFAINRTDDACHTPLNNKDVNTFLSEFIEDFFAVAREVKNDVVDLMSIESQYSDRYNFDFKSSLSHCNNHVPVVPLVEEGLKFTCLGLDSLDILYANERSCLSKAVQDITTIPPSVQLCDRNCVVVAVVVEHLSSVSLSIAAALHFIEEGIRRQLRAAISEDITPEQFNDFMSYQQLHLFREEYQMLPFNSIIRRPRHFPEGVLHLPEHMFTKTHPAVSSLLKFRGLDLRLQGSLSIHSWITYSFANVAPTVNFEARSRQFSGYILLVGTLTTGNTFIPDTAMILQNRDELHVALKASKLPSPGEFRDYIAALSPEMQRFAKSFRLKQLAGTLTAFAVVQLKPHLERLVNLPEGSLTKEIGLTQDLIKLLVEYQIPPDILSFDEAIVVRRGAEKTDTKEKIGQVRQSVDDMLEMVRKELEQMTTSKERERRYEDDATFEAIRVDLAMETEMELVSAAMPSASAVHASVPPTKPTTPTSDATPEANSLPQETTSPTTTKEDFTSIPYTLEANMLKFDPRGAMKPTKLTPLNWIRYSRDIFGADTKTVLEASDLEKDTDRAFDLLDSLTKTGDLPLENTEVHVFLTVTHSFVEMVLENVIKNNENIIESAEASLLVMASSIYGVEPSHLVRDGAIPRLQNYSSILFPTP